MTFPHRTARAARWVGPTLTPARRVGPLLITALLVTAALAGCGTEDRPAAVASPNGDSTASTDPTPSPSPTPTPSPSPLPDRDGDGRPDLSDPYPDDPKNVPQQEPVILECTTGEEWTASVTVAPGKGGRPDFTEAWSAKATSCEAPTAIRPVSALEKKALKASKYDDGDIATLYTICAEIDPDDAYAEPGFAASAEQIAEINAALLLCPTHPYAKKWRAAVQRGQVDADLEAQGRLFGAGTFRVGKEIKPGTYVTTDVEGCYWERQDSSGQTIDNYFTNSARRVQVTIRSSDYAFNSENCGQWRPAS
ncbi:hypothetical protein [Micromonospora siamensis]|uniref:Uncharacterized protein n=1 Tax=Micromonospora siamensis TaxID=299152 RepID=A0A1C5J4U0_9ACTN|nr:hypothetical protein [Micromonospora siamensis]SCG65056.1 hypothetical protein GA0074704_4074 [Micromonospora siamensis]